MRAFSTLSAASLLVLAGTTASFGCGMASFVDADPRALYASGITAVESTAPAADSVTITVTFETATGGWTEPQLVPVTYFVAPYDGIYEIYVMAIPPEEAATQSLQPMTASLELPVGEGIAGYRILADQGCVTLMLDGAALPEGGDGCTVQSLTVS